MSAFVLAAAFALARHQADDFPKLWDQVSQSISARYYARQTRGEDMKRLLVKYKPIASQATNRAEFSRAVNEMIAEFHDSHFAFYGNDQQGFYVMDGLVRGKNVAELPNIGAYFRQKGDTYTVQMVLEGTEAAKADLRKGDVISLADGKPFSPVTSFAGEGLVKLSVLRSGQKLDKEVHPTKEDAMDMFLDATKESAKVIEDNGRKIGYMHLWTQANASFRDALSNAVYGKLANTDAFILDLRDGFGGRPEGFADPFFRPEVKLDWETPLGTSHQIFGYQRPLVVLINEGSRSAKEVLSLILQTSHRATLVGSTTAGNVLGTFPAKLNDWAYIEIPMTDVLTDGVRLEGRGVSPNIAVPQEFDAEGHDLFLAKALDILKDVKIRAANPGQ